MSIIKDLENYEYNKKYYIESEHRWDFMKDEEKQKEYFENIQSKPVNCNFQSSVDMIGCGSISGGSTITRTEVLRTMVDPDGDGPEGLDTLENVIQKMYGDIKENNENLVISESEIDEMIDSHK